MVSKAGKLLLKNTIQSLEYKNKIKEEKEMWNRLRNERNGREGRDGLKPKQSKAFDDYCRKRDSTEDKHKSMSKRDKKDDTKPDNYWLKKLMAEEDKLSNERWTHNGFKELYSQELDSNESSVNTSSTSEEVSEEEMKKRNKKRKRKQKLKEKDKKNKKKHKKRDKKRK